jgi:hypothetical protein
VRRGCHAAAAILSVVALVCLEQHAAGKEPPSHSDLQANEINGGWYGWIGNHKVHVYDPSMDADFLRRHHVNWYWLGHQWVVPFLVADMADVRKTMIEEGKRARIWVELYWWGNHSTWEGFVGMSYPGLYERLKEKGVRPGGADLRGKDWFAMADDPAVMNGVKKTLQWQLETIVRSVGPDTVYGVLFSEEEPDHGVNVTLGPNGMQRYGQDRTFAQEKLIKVHNELYDYVKSRFPQLKISPGFYPAWVRPGTLKYDAVVMDNYPPPGQEEQYLRQWQAAYGEAREQYILLWGYGDLDYKLELARMEKMTRLCLARGIKNIGYFRPELSLRDPVFRWFDTRGVGSYAPYDIQEHRRTVTALLGETRQTLVELEGIQKDATHKMSLATLADATSRDGLCRQADDIYACRKSLLDRAYEKLNQCKELAELDRLADLAEAEGWIAMKQDRNRLARSEDLRRWETLSKEFQTLPEFYAAVLPRGREANASASTVAQSLESAAAQDGPESGELAQAAKALKSGRFAAACAHTIRAREQLAAAKQERSWQVSLRLGNRYPYPLNVTVILSADCGGGGVRELYRGVPFESSAASRRSFAFYLPRPPESLTVATSPWSGTVDVESLRVYNSRETLNVASVLADHAENAEACVGRPEASFILLPWASESSVKLKMRSGK